jgi:hypothetical protein
LSLRTNAISARRLREAIAFSAILCARALAHCSVVLPPRTKFRLRTKSVAGSPPMQAVRASRFILACRGTVNEVAHNQAMRKGDIICPECRAGLRRIELSSRKGHAGEFRCPLCDCVLEVSDGSTEIAYRLTVAPEKLFD